MTHTSPARLRALGLLLIFLSGIVLVAISHATPALADDTDGGNGQGSGTGSDGCTLAGWTLVNDADEMVWQADGGGAACGNTAYQNRNSWTSISWTDNEARAHTCTVGSGCSGSGGGNWVGGNAPLYTALSSINANACWKRTDVYGIWYLSDAPSSGNPASWTNLGPAPRPLPDYRNVSALKDAIDDTTVPGFSGLYQSNGNGTNAWWDARIRLWKGSATYDEQVRAYGADAVRQDAKTTLKASIIDATGGNNPVIFCWYKQASSSGQTCSDILGSSFVWNDWLHPAGVTPTSPFSDNCVLRCPTTQGQYPNPLPHAGQWIPASVGMAGAASWCYPPITYTWHQGGYGSTIPGIGYTLVSTHGDDSYGGSWPYAYITSAEDGNGVYDAATQRGNAPNQGQLTTSNATKTTAFGLFWSSYCADPATCASGIQDDSGQGPSQAFIYAYNAAVAALPNETHATLNLTAAQKAQVAKGRIVNVYERTKYASATAARYLDRFYIRVATWTRTFDFNGNELPTGATFSAWSPDAAAHPSYNSETVPSAYAGQYRPDFSTAHPDLQRWAHNETIYTTPKVSGLWQAAATHCNNQEFALLNPAGNASGTNDTGVLDTGDSTQYYSASAVLKVSDSKWRVNETVDLTQARWGALTHNASSKPAFFDRLCYYPGKAKVPTTSADKSAAAQAEYSLFRDNVAHTVEGTGGDGDSPFFVPDFTGEDRTTTVTIVDGYRADKRTQTAADKWTLDADAYEFNGTYTYNPGTPTYYAGSFAESWTCNTGRSGFCTGSNGNPCGHEQALQSGRWGPATYVPGHNYSNCVNRYYYHDTTYPGIPASNTPNYQWNHKHYEYSSQADGDAGLAYCGAAGWSNCALVKTDATWTPWASASVPSCPQADTATTQFRNCVAVTHDETTTTSYNVVNYQNTDPTQILLTRDPLSTPKAEWTKIAGLTNSGAARALFSQDGNTSTPRSAGVFQSQFDSSPSFSSLTVAVASGGYRRLQAQSTWASTKQLPQVLTLAWYYAPTVKTTVPLTNIGFGRQGGLMTYNAGDASSLVRGRVEAEAGTLQAPNDGRTLAQHQNEVWSNTGTNIVDNLNVPLYYGAARAAAAPYGWTSSPTAASPHYYTIRFVRAVGQGEGE